MSQYDQLLLFYNRLLTIADEIEDMIKKELFDDILDKIQIHDKIFVQIKLAKKCSDLTEEQQTKIDDIGICGYFCDFVCRYIYCSACIGHFS